MAMVIDCPGCGRQLRLTDALIGHNVNCPRCGATFPAVEGPAPPRPTPPQLAAPPQPEPGPFPDAPPPTRAPMDDRPWEEATRYVRRDGEPHRGGLILTFGILSIVLGMTGILAVVGLVFGILAWVMGSRDGAKMREGVMDPQGQSTTQAGFICGIIGTVISGLYSLCCIGYFGIVFTAIFTASSAPVRSAPPGRPVRPVPIPGKILLERPSLSPLVRSF